MNTSSPHRTAWSQIAPGDRDAWTAFRRAAATVMARLERDLLEQSGIGYSDFDVLMQLSLAREESSRMADLARAVALSPSALTRLVQRLEHRGLVSRTHHRPTIVEVSLTAAGRKALNEAAPPHLQSVEAAFWAPLTTSERVAITSICGKIIKSATEISTPTA
jgi:DNA-binding MarR family transcriptional regulator